MTQTISTVDSVARMSRDIAAAAGTMTADEARFLVDAYYIQQEDRKRSINQTRALDESGEPNAVLAWLAMQSETLEHQIKRALDKYTDAHPVGVWLKSNHGIGPVIAAGLLAHIDMNPWRCVRKWKHDPNPYYDLDPKTKPCNESEPHGPECRRMPCETSGQIHRFAGLDPTLKWNKGEKRPWNASLKTLCWKTGQSFMKFHGDEKCYYGHVYAERKTYEIARNDRGDNAARAAEILTERAIGKTTDAFKHYASGKLPPAQIDARARRYAVKLFLSHLHDVWYRHEFGKAPPLPYPIAILGHAHYIAPPTIQHESTTAVE